MTNFAGALAIGLSGVDAQLRLRVAVAFGLFEGGMPMIGLLLGRQVAVALGSHTNDIAAVLLVLTGSYTIFSSLRNNPENVRETDRWDTARLLATGPAFERRQPGDRVRSWYLSRVVRGRSRAHAAVSVAMSLAGLELGSRLGEHLGQHTEHLAGAILIAVGGAIGAGAI